MNNTERLFLYTLPHWSGVTVKLSPEKLSDMWIRGENAAHHSSIPYDPDGIELLRKEILKDFLSKEFNPDRKSTRLNSSHLVISYAVFCLKKKNHLHTLTCH